MSHGSKYLNVVLFIRNQLFNSEIVLGSKLKLSQSLLGCDTKNLPKISEQK
jgi:hypothetical protein